MIYIAVYWIVLSLGALGPALLAAWRLRCYVTTRIIYLVIAMLIGQALDNAIWAGLLLIALPSFLDQPFQLDVSGVLLTIGYTVRTVTAAVLGLSLILVFAGGGPSAPGKDVV